MIGRTVVLIAEDDPVSREIMAHLLERHGYRIIVAKDGREALAAAGPEIDVALIDWMMPGVDGVEVCRKIKECTGDSAYVIMVTARTEKSDIVHALDSGADDYVTKPVNHQELMARVRAGERVARRERGLVEAFEEAQSAADVDALTGLMSRRRFDRELVDRVRELRAGESLALLMIDLDHFKRVNDQYGHQAGDAVLRQVAAVIRAEIREGIDLVARYGGEELVVVAPRTSHPCAVDIGRRIRRRIAQARIVAEGVHISVTASIGVAVAGGPLPEVELHARALIEEADQRLYEAKHAGRNRVAA
jgi:two-component system, cell cycle response regulator